MTLFLLGLAVFLGVHSVAIVAPGFRDSARARFGEGAWKGLYSLASLAGFVMLCYGFALARRAPVVLYVPPDWLRYVAVVLMLPVFPLLFASGMPGRIQAATKHPMLVAVKCWGLAHLLANGRLADILLFGGFLAWAVVDRISLKRRPPKSLPMAPARPWNDAVALGLGLVVYGVTLVWGHRWLFGVAPLG